jgi:hypothetical protein
MGGDSFSLPFCHLPLHHPFLQASFEVNLASPEALCSGFIVFSFNNCIDHPLSINSPINGIHDSSHPRISSLYSLLEIFSFDFFKIISIHFGKPSPSAHPSTVFLGVAAFIHRLIRHHPTTMRRSVSNTHLWVDLTRRCVQSTHCPLRCCISDVTSPPRSPLFPVHFHRSMLYFGLFYLLFSLFSIYVSLLCCYFPSLVPFLFSAVLAFYNHFSMIVSSLVKDSSQRFFAIFTALCGPGIGSAYL